MNTHKNDDTCSPRAMIEKYGIHVIPGVLSPDQATYYRNKLTDYVNQVNPQVSHGVIQHYEIGHQQFMWDLRCEPTLLNAFADLWNCSTESLLCSFDGANYIPAPESTKRPRYRHHEKPWLHVDQGSKYQGLHTIQGMVALSKMSPDDATFCYLEKSHLGFEKLMTELSDTLPNNKLRRNYHKVPPHMYDTLGPLRHISLNPGDLLLWDSRLVHANARAVQGRTDPCDRAAAYVCMKPHKDATEKQLSRKRKAFSELRTTSHDPIEFTLNGKNPQVWGNKNKLAVYTDAVRRYSVTPHEPSTKILRLAGYL